MAAVTHRDATLSSSNVATYNSGAFTPTVGDLLLFFVVATDTVAAGAATGSANGITFTRISSATKGASPDTIYAFVSDQLVPGSPASMTCQFDCTGDNATGAIVCVASVAGVTRTGLSAIKQHTEINTGTGGTTPVFTFGAAVQTGNPTLATLGTVSAAGTTPPTGWTERADITYATPTTGGGYVSRDSGYTGTTITWGSTATAHGGVAIEIDTTSLSVAGLPELVMAPRIGV